jgi:hypothetical protein
MSDITPQEELMAEGIPESAKMQPIDKLAADIMPAIDAVPTTAPMGAPSGTIDVAAPAMPVGLNLENPKDPMMGAAGLAGALQNPYSLDTWQNFYNNMTGQKAPINLVTGEPLQTPNIIPLTDEPAVIAPEQQTITKKVGDTTTTMVEPTAGGLAALAATKDAAAGIDEAAKLKGQVAQEVALHKSEVDAKRALASDKYFQESEKLLTLAQQEMKKSQDEISRLRQEYATKPWQSFWGEKSIGDKLMLSLAVGLGAMGQAKLGGQNVAMALLNSKIDDFNKTQEGEFRKLESQLSSSQSNMVQQQQAIQGLFQNLVATRTAAYDQLDKQLANVGSRVNTLSAKAENDQLRNELKLKAQKDIFNMEQELAARTSTRMDIFDTKSVKGNPKAYVKADGSEMKESEAKAYSAFINIAPALKDIEELENNGFTNSTSYKNYKTALATSFRNFGVLNGPLDALAALNQFDSNMRQTLAGDVNAQRYHMAFMKMMTDKLRYDSGANIALSESTGFAQTYLPSDISENSDKASQEANLAQVRKNRRTFLESMLGTSGSSNKPWYAAGGKK